MMGRRCSASIKVPIWISSSRLGSTTNQKGHMPCACAFSKEGGGLTMVTSTPPFDHLPGSLQGVATNSIDPGRGSNRGMLVTLVSILPYLVNTQVHGVFAM